ncbi:hypothetical protein EON65_28205 [archaeon]|nr:MAG: hypothetical protein EON65_28205 [archaeon]
MDLSSLSMQKDAVPATSLPVEQNQPPPAVVVAADEQKPSADAQATSKSHLVTPTLPPTSFTDDNVSERRCVYVYLIVICM